MPKQIGAVSGEYRPFTREAAASVAKEFGIEGKEDALFKLVTQMTETYEKFRGISDYQQRKAAIEELRKAIREVARLATRHQKALELPLDMTPLPRLLGELLTYEGIEKLLGHGVGRLPTPPEESLWDDHDGLTRFDRSWRASREGSKLLSSLFVQMRSALDQPRGPAPPSKGGRPIAHPYRHVIAMELATHWDWFFEKRPTITPTGKFAKFCLSVLNQLECDTTGFKKTLPDILDDAGTHFAPNRRPRSRRKSSSRK